MNQERTLNLLGLMGHICADGVGEPADAVSLPTFNILMHDVHF